MARQDTLWSLSILEESSKVNYRVCSYKEERNLVAQPLYDPLNQPIAIFIGG